MGKQATTKEKELEIFESNLLDFVGEEPTKRKIIESWKNYLVLLSNYFAVSDAWYKLTMEEKRKLYSVAGLE